MSKNKKPKAPKIAKHKVAKEKLEIPCIACGEMFPLDGISDPDTFICDGCYTPEMNGDKPPITDADIFDIECTDMPDCECPACLQRPDWA